MFAPRSAIDVAREVTAQDHPQRAHRVLGADLLAFVVRAAVITDRHFVNRGLPLGELDGDFGLDAEPVAADRDASRQRQPERLVAGLHVGQVEVRRHVAGRGQEMVRQRVPVVDHAPLAGDQEARPVDHIGLVGQQRTQHFRVLGGVVFQVGVLDDAEFAHRVFQCRADGRALAASSPCGGIPGRVRDTARRAHPESAACSRWSRRPPPRLPLSAPPAKARPARAVIEAARNSSSL